MGSCVNNWQLLTNCQVKIMVKSWERMCGYKTIQFFIIHQSKTFTDEEKTNSRI